jgi:ribose 5-phosphate isomerase A
MASADQPQGRLLEESAKRAAAYQAVKDYLDPCYRYVGIGSGSTVVHVVEAIAAKGSEFSANMTFIPTGSQSKAIIKAAGLRLCRLDERPLGDDGSPVPLDVAFDGADEVDDELNCIKGGGACLLQEKLVAVAAVKFIVVADYRKLSPRLCTRWKTVPIEVLPLAAPDVLACLKKLGSDNPVIRSGLPSKAGECVTDNGMWIIDAPFKPLRLPSDGTIMPKASVGTAGTENLSDVLTWEIDTLAEQLIRLPGVVEIGLFYGRQGTDHASSQKPLAAYFGMQDGTVFIRR